MNSSQVSLCGCTVPNICDVSYPLKQKVSTDAPVRVTELILPQLFSCEEKSSDPFVQMFFSVPVPVLVELEKPMSYSLLSSAECVLHVGSYRKTKCSLQ